VMVGITDSWWSVALMVVGLVLAAWLTFGRRMREASDG